MMTLRGGGAPRGEVEVELQEVSAAEGEEGSLSSGGCSPWELAESPWRLLVPAGLGRVQEGSPTTSSTHEEGA